MSEKKLLNDEELDKVTGGGWAEKMSKYLPNTHGEHIGMYAASSFLGQDVYAVYDHDREEYFWGTLEDSYEDLCGIGTLRMHKIKIIGVNNYKYNDYKGKEGQTVSIKGDNFTLFLYK